MFVNKVLFSVSLQPFIIGAAFTQKNVPLWITNDMDSYQKCVEVNNTNGYTEYQLFNFLL